MSEWPMGLLRRASTAQARAWKERGPPVLDERPGRLACLEGAPVELLAHGEAREPGLRPPRRSRFLIPPSSGHRTSPSTVDLIERIPADPLAVTVPGQNLREWTEAYWIPSIPPGGFP